MHRLLTLIGALIVTVTPVAAQPPSSADAVIAQMKAAFEPVRPSVRTMVITVSDMGEKVKFVVGQARKQLADGKYMATALLQPADLRGSAFLVSEFKDPKKPRVVWIWLPVIRRLKRVLPVEAYNHFLGTDFTYADLGFVRQHKDYKLLGTEQHAGAKAYKIDEKLPPDQYYYSHMVLWIAQSNMLPLQRDYYEPGGTLWKTEVFDSVTTVDGAPTVLHVKMTDLLGNTSTDLNVTQIKYDVQVPDSLFDPQNLSKLADDPLWQAGGGAP